MAKSKTTWKSGQSGNPNGRPPKVRALTEILEAAGSHTVEYDGKKISGKRLLARYLWEAATFGYVTLPPDAQGKQEKLVFDPKDWFDVVKFLYQHIDGPPKAELDLTSGGDKIIVTLSGGDDA